MRNDDDNGSDFGLFMIAWGGSVILVLVIMWLIVTMANRV